MFVYLLHSMYTFLLWQYDRIIMSDISSSYFQFNSIFDMIIYWGLCYILQLISSVICKYVYSEYLIPVKQLLCGIIEMILE